MRQRRAAAMSSARAAREREQRRGKGSRESARGFQGVAWSCGRRPGRGGGSQAGWLRGELGGVAVSLLCLLARGGRRQGEAPGGLGRTGGLPAQELGRLLAPGGALGGLQVGGPGRLLLFFIFLFCFLLFNLLPLF